MYATAKIGVVMVTVNPIYKSHELDYVLKQSDMKALCVIDAYRDVDYLQIIRGGENIYPLEVENFLLTMPGVLDAQVVGIPDARLGEIVGAFIRVRPGYEGMTEEDVRAFAIPRIARYKVPKRVFFVDDFPMTPSMKVQKFKLREMAEDLVRAGK